MGERMKESAQLVSSHSGNVIKLRVHCSGGFDV
jgi:hypothetical protein